jgi:hypothetical protein
MLTLTEQEIAAEMGSCPDLRGIRAKIARAEQELQQSHEAMAGVPESVRKSLLMERQILLEHLLERGEVIENQARDFAIQRIKKAYVETLKKEAYPLLEKAAKAIETARNNLLKVVEIERDAATNQGSVMTERFGPESVAFYLPSLTYQPERGAWSLRRR